MSAVDTSPDLAYFVDDAGHIGTFNTATNEIREIASTPYFLTDIALSRSGQLYVCTASTLYSVDVASGSLTPLFTFTGDIADMVNAMEFAADGTLHLHGANGAHATLNAALTSESQSVKTGAISNGDLLINAAGHEYLSSGNSLVEITADNRAVPIYSGGGLSMAYGLSYDKQGNIDVFSGTSIYRLDVSTGLLTEVARVDSSFGILTNINGATSINDTAPGILTQPPVTETTAQALSDFAAHQVATPLHIRDQSSAILGNLDGLQAIAAAGKISAISFIDGTSAILPTLGVGLAQFQNDRDAIEAIANDFPIAVDVSSAANVTLSGMGGHASMVSFSGNASQYIVTPVGDNTSLTVTDSGTGRASTDHFSGLIAIRFADVTEVVAAAPVSGGGASTGNIAELYGAVFGRQPDLTGLAFYENYLTQHPQTQLVQFAQFFLASTEYATLPAHNYGQSAAGDAQFITDSYNNLLHRAPEAGAVAFYQGVVSRFTQGLTSGTADYAAAQVMGHAWVLTYFSASSEFLNNVQITAAHPADASHWLQLV